MVLKKPFLTWGRFGFDGGGSGLLSESREACVLVNKVCIKCKRRRQFCISSLI
ncbi:hypothetical protein CNEO4_590052 [Clostridium neonatale]|nr:hypothetical protein CNEO2_130092 [Clostridium neonatale]CAI3571684.1 hypothetical protein CNEO4_430034 [Clostridium neonatale]CAI3578495.1 hypothetical protein CNEO3_30109 [Clostridium neonatale]CAI3617170.1 hypothetical protein CNEO4_510022 [Clostridium neonatale]CAI3660285.1 hypothetical protein CNEO3_420034 [Clostridium neonatale]